MSNQWNSEPGPPSNGSAVPGSDDRPRLGPRPLLRPTIDPGAAATFGRPAGVSGAFSAQTAQSAQSAQSFGQLRTAPPAPESLASAFGRPDGSQEVLQRPPADENGSGVDPWDPEAAHDPWRDPSAGAVIGPPAVGPDKQPETAPAPKQAGKLLSLPELLFGRRVKVTALVLLAVIALVIGVAGGIAAYFVVNQGDQLTSDTTLAEVQPGKERPPGSVADIAKRVRPAVVTIEVRSDQAAGVGSGAVIDSAGYVLTNEHVVTLGGAVTQGQKITVVFNDGQRAEAKLVGSDPKMDLAVIKVDADVDVSTVIQLGKSADLAVGDTVLAIGSPLGETDTVTQGIVSALNRPIVVGGEDGEPAVYDAIQTDAAINHGNSGGPLVDSTGALVGINTSIISTSEEGGSIGLGYAIPIDDARPIAEQIIKTGKVKHADIGVNAASVSAETAEGARVQNVREGGAASKAGIQQNDVIRKVGDRVVGTAAELIVAVRHHNIGDTVPVVLARSGRELTVQVTLQSD
jgi:S1-C subfamily serine protease